MKWLFILILFISCTQDEDMKLYSQNLNSNSGTLRVLLLTGQSNAVGLAFNVDAMAGELIAQPQIQIWPKGLDFEDLNIGTFNNY